MDKKSKEFKILRKKIDNIMKFMDWFHKLDKICLKNTLNNLSQEDFDKKIEVILFMTWLDASNQSDKTNAKN